MRYRSCALTALMLLFLALLLPMPGALAGEAADITGACVFRGSNTATKYTMMTDGRYTSAWNHKQARDPWVTVKAPDGQKIHALYLCFSYMPDTWEIQTREGGEWTTYRAGDMRFFHQTVDFPEGVTDVRVIASGRKVSLGFNELHAFGEGDLPAWVQRWEPTPDKCDILFISAHPDDELIFFAGGIPTYAAEKRRSTVVAYLSYSNPTRRSELLNGLWLMGVRNYPVIGPFRDSFQTTKKAVWKSLGGEEKVLAWFTDLYRSVRPQVVVTHDTDGEYGHPQHKVTAEMAQRAYDTAAAAETDPKLEALLTRHEPWQVKKLYLHLWPEDRITMDWGVPLSALGGKTGEEIAEEAYKLHVTQRASGMSVTETGAKYDNTVFGLCRTEVGPDEAGGDFLEHITDLVPQDE